MGLTLREGNREYFYKKLDTHFPSLKEKYINEFGKRYAVISPNNRNLMRLFKKLTDENNILNNPQEIFNYLREFPEKTHQTTLI